MKKVQCSKENQNSTKQHVWQVN